MTDIISVPEAVKRGYFMPYISTLAGALRLVKSGELKTVLNSGNQNRKFRYWLNEEIINDWRRKNNLPEVPKKEFSTGLVYKTK